VEASVAAIAKRSCLPNKSGTKPLHLSEIYWLDILPNQKAAGLMPEDATVPRFSCHSLRHYFASILITDLRYDAKRVSHLLGPC
jgi:integrase